MRSTIRKLFWAWNFDKEETWLNSMAAKGLALVAVGYCKYTFEECTPGKYNIRLELLDNLPTYTKSQQYINFVEETGAEYLGSVMRWAYFRNETDNGEFNLFSDNASRIKHLNRLLTLLGVISFMNICIGLGNTALHVGTGVHGNLILTAIHLSIVLFLACGFFRVYLKKRKIKKEQQLFE